MASRFSSAAELRRIRDVGQGDGVAVDLSRREDVTIFFDAAANYLGNFDIAVINAAIPAEALAETPADELEYQIATDFTSYLTTSRIAAKQMKAGADLILIGSMAAVSQAGGNSIYVAAKSGIEGFAHSLRQELSDQDIKVGLIEPGFTGADFQYPDYSPEKQVELINQHRMLRAEDIAVAAHFMLTQPRRTAVSLMRVETRLKHP
jgi:3-oxoacyl-[acyl-carrier protein] reductase